MLLDTLGAQRQQLCNRHSRGNATDVVGVPDLEATCTGFDVWGRVGGNV